MENPVNSRGAVSDCRLTNQQLKQIKDKMPKELKKFVKAHISQMVEQSAIETLSCKGEYNRIL